MGLAYNLYENNGVIKREDKKTTLNKLYKQKEKFLREAGVKFGR